MNRQDKEQMYSLYEQWQASGKSKAAFATAQGIPPSTFYYWAKKFEQETSLSSIGFECLTIDASPNKNSGGLMAAIDYPSGVRLELYSSFEKVNNSYAQMLKMLTV